MYIDNGKSGKDNGEVNNFEDRLNFIKSLSHYPKQSNEHNALADAKWNKELHNFIKSL